MERKRIRRKKRRRTQRGDDQQFGAAQHITPTPETTAPDYQAMRDAIQAPSAQTLTPEVLQRLQSSHGNQFVNQLVQRSQAGMGERTIQRLPTRQDVVGLVGAPKEDKVKKGKVKKANSTMYKPILAALDALSNYMNGTTLPDMAGLEQRAQRGAITTAFKPMIQLYDDVDTAVKAYLDDKDGGFFSSKGEKRKVKYFERTLKPQIAAEKATAAQVMLNLLDNPQVASNQTIQALMTAGADANAPTQLGQGDVTGTLGGGINALQVIGGQEKVFKGGKDSIAEYNQDIEDRYLDEVMALQEKGDVEGARAKMKEQQALQNEAELTGHLGIDRNDPRLSQRDVAMSRLDQLLGTEVIARTQMALMNDGVNEQEGSLMEQVQQGEGERGGDLAAADHIVADPTQRDNANIYGADSRLQKSLSNLQIVDILAHQIDRNMGNYFIHFDDNGRVTGVTGIDNDMSFGTQEDVETRFNEYPGLTNYVDREVAETILNLDVDILKWIMEDLLPEREINALIVRLGKLQQHLSTLQSEGKLLEPEDWNLFNGIRMNGEIGSYYNKLVHEVYDPRD